jgi:hypothetical protein
MRHFAACSQAVPGDADERAALPSTSTSKKSSVVISRHAVSSLPVARRSD